MRPLHTLVTKEFVDEFYAPVADLGVSEVRFTEADGEIDALFFIVPTATSEIVETALVERVRSLWGTAGLDLGILRESTGPRRARMIVERKGRGGFDA
ncbi:MAG TPA: hypothetical protein VF407_06340 [Polyangiaceae bacterium]